MDAHPPIETSYRAAPPTAFPAAGPTRESDRIASLDILRGFALFGILLVNIGFFAAGAMNLERLRWWQFPAADASAYLFVDFFGSYKFVSLFSMLFGMGLALQSRRADARGRPFAGLFARRMLILLGIGILHGVFLWYGDILSMYAILGLIALPFRRARARTLIIIAAVLILVPVFVVGALTAMSSTPPPESFSWAELADQIEAEMKSQRAATMPAGVEGAPSESSPQLTEEQRESIEFFRRMGSFLDSEVELYGNGPWTRAILHRAVFYVLFINIKIGFLILGWRCLALFMIGMALVKTGIMLRPADHRRFFKYLVVVGFPVGAALQLFGLLAPWLAGVTVWTNLVRELGLYVGGIGMALGYVGCITLMSTSPRYQRWLGSIGDAGRMALTHYVGQSVICGLIFYSVGFGLIGRIDYFWIVPITFGIYALQVFVSPLWLRVFQFGPLEWLWRSLTYRKRQPMLRPA